MSRRAVRWRDWSGEGIEHLALEMGPETVVADAVVVAPGQPPFAAAYRLVLGADWRVRQVSARIIGTTKSVELSSDGAGRWHAADGAAVPELDGADDIDLAVTPFTNTLPIRRLALPVGASAEIRPIYVSFPDLAVGRDPQRYTRLGETTYRYESLDGDFRRDIEVDADGLVTVYPGLFRRSL